MTQNANQETAPPPHSMSEVVNRLHDAAAGEETSLGDVVESLGNASFVPVLITPALAVITPLSGIPLVSSLCGLCIALVAGQLLLGRRQLWLPRWLTRRAVPSMQLRDAADWLKRPANWIDKHTGRRLSVLVDPPFDRMIYLACTLCGAIMPVFEVVPFTSSVLGAAVALMSLTLLVRDGLFALLGFGVIGAAVLAAILTF
ncbi:MAG: exopolysaccharide biosynthesis protein [Pseudomonadota bacterium]|nr:exopolysaccharide biosynthesis protein [Pseudomonadota bacterium]